MLKQLGKFSYCNNCLYRYVCIIISQTTPNLFRKNKNWFFISLHKLISKSLKIASDGFQTFYILAKRRSRWYKVHHTTIWIRHLQKCSTILQITRKRNKISIILFLILCTLNELRAYRCGVSVETTDLSHQLRITIAVTFIAAKEEDRLEASCIFWAPCFRVYSM